MILQYDCDEIVTKKYTLPWGTRGEPACGFFYEKMLQAVVFCTFRPRRPAWFHMVRGLKATVALPCIRAQDPSRIEYSAPGCLSGLCRHGTCARRPGRNVLFSCLVVPAAQACGFVSKPCQVMMQSGAIQIRASRFDASLFHEGQIIDFRSVFLLLLRLTIYGLTGYSVSSVIYPMLKA